MQAAYPDSFAYLKDLLTRLSREELRQIRLFIKNNGIDDSKIFNLLKLLFNDEKITESVACGLLYGKKESLAFEKLVCRLKEKIHEALMRDVNLKRVDAYSEYYKNWFWVKKDILLSQVLLGRGLYNEVQMMYERIIKVSKEFELYNELAEVLRLKQAFTGLRYGIKEFKKLSIEIEFVEKCRAARYFAKDAYHLLITHQDFKADNLDSSLIDDLDGTIDQLERLYNDTFSNYVKFYLLLIRMDRAQKLNRYDDAIEEGRQLIRLLKNSPAIYMKRNLANALTNQSINYLMAHDFNKAIKEAKSAIALLNETNYNYLIPSEVEFYVLFYKNEIDKAITIMRQLLQFKTITPFQKSKYNYLLATCYFIQNELYQAKQLLSECDEIENDKEGWNPMIRIFQIQLFISTEKYDLASNSIENLIKYLQRLNLENGFSSRLSNIVKLLSKLDNCGFNFKKLFEYHQDLIDKISAKDSQAAWKIKSSEPLIFQVWLRSQLRSEAIEFKSFFKAIPSVKEKIKA